MTNGEKKAILMKYQDRERRTNRLLDEKERWEDKDTSVPPVYSDMPKGGTSDKVQTAVCRIIELEQDIDREVDAQIDLRGKIEAAVSGMQDEKLRDVIRYRYIDGMKWEEVAEAMYYSRMQICRFHGRALREIML